MKANYHMHTYRCQHADGTEREYVEESIKAGHKIIGFSDHTPQFFPGDYVSPVRMLPKELPGYVDTVLALKKEYERDIEIHLGLEVEYYEEGFEKLLRFLEDFPIEYMILGQHFTHMEFNGSYTNIPHDDEARLIDYCSTVIAGIRTGCFSYLCHPDVVNFTGPKELYIKHLSAVIDEAIKADLPLEYNLLGQRDKRNYPTPLFWEMVKGTGAKVIFGTDAHHTIDVNRPEDAVIATKYLSTLGITPMETLDLSKRKF